MVWLAIAMVRYHDANIRIHLSFLVHCVLCDVCYPVMVQLGINEHFHCGDIWNHDSIQFSITSFDILNRRMIPFVKRSDRYRYTPRIKAESELGGWESELEMLGKWLLAPYRPMSSSVTLWNLETGWERIPTAFLDCLCVDLDQISTKIQWKVKKISNRFQCHWICLKFPGYAHTPNHPPNHRHFETPSLEKEDSGAIFHPNK